MIREQNTIHILLDNAILLRLAFGIIVLPLQLVFLLSQLLILSFQGVEIGQLLKALLFQGLGCGLIENQGAFVLAPEPLFISGPLIFLYQWTQFFTGGGILYSAGRRSAAFSAAAASVLAAVISATRLSKSG